MIHIQQSYFRPFRRLAIPDAALGNEQRVDIKKEMKTFTTSFNLPARSLNTLIITLSFPRGSITRRAYLSAGRLAFVYTRLNKHRGPNQLRLADLQEGLKLNCDDAPARRTG